MVRGEVAGKAVRDEKNKLTVHWNVVLEYSIGP